MKCECNSSIFNDCSGEVKLRRIKVAWHLKEGELCNENDCTICDGHVSYYKQLYGTYSVHDLSSVVFAQLHLGPDQGLAFLVKPSTVDGFLVFIDPVEIACISDLDPFEVVENEIKKILKTNDFILRMIDKEDMLKLLTTREIANIYGDQL